MPALVLGGTGTSAAEQLVRWKHRASLRTGWQEVALPRLHNHASRNSNVEVIKALEQHTWVGVKVRAGTMEWSKPICTMPGISTLDNIPPHQILKDGRRGEEKKIDVNARRFTRGFKDWETVTHYLSKCQWNVKGSQSALSTSDTTQMLLRASLLPFHLMGKHVGLVGGRMH